MKRLLRIIYVFAACLSGGGPEVAAQGRAAGGPVLVQGFTLQRDSLTPAPYVTVTNRRSRFGTISTDNGYFVLQAQRGDTLEFSAVNLHSAVYVVPPYYAAARVSVRAVLTTRTYQLDEVVVRPYTEKQFKKDFLALQLPDEQPDLQLPAIPRLATPSGAAQNGVGVTLGAPISALYNAFSREAKSRRKLATLLAADQRKKMYAAKLNPGFVGRVTGLAGPDLEAFLKYCTLTESFVIEADEYEVAQALQSCLKTFRAERN